MLTEQEALEFRRDGVVSRGPHPARIGQVLVYGERWSGANRLTTVLCGLYGLRRDKAHGWKHGAPVFVAANRFSLFLVALRDPFDWAVSLYARPLYATPATSALSFDDFIVAPWQGVMARPKGFNLEPRAFRGQVLQPDRHPITGRPFASIFEMRSVKLRAWLGLFERDVPVALVDTDRFVEDPEPCLAHMEHHFPLDRRLWDWEQPDDLTPHPEEVEARRAHALERLPACREAIVSRLDHDLERICGYLD